MSQLLYLYIAKPTPTQVGGFLRALSDRGVTISHLGKSDPPRKFNGSIEDAVTLVFTGTDLTKYTFGRDSVHKLHFDIQIHLDPRWTHSTVSATCPDPGVLGFVVTSAATAFDLFIAAGGVSGGGKEQSWEVLHPPSERCPDDLRSRFVGA